MTNPHQTPYDNVLATIGWTPLIRLGRVGAGIRTPVYGKAEYANPGGSVKDRIGLAIIEDAEQRGDLKPGGTIVEGTSGNTGVGIAVAAAISLFGLESGAALATVVGVLIEVPLMLAVVRVVNGTEAWYEAGAARARAA